jgi:hypothetical protein
LALLVVLRVVVEGFAQHARFAHEVLYGAADLHDALTTAARRVLLA